MGISGVILKGRKNVDFQKTLRDVEYTSARANLEVKIDSEICKMIRGEGVYTTATIADTYEDIPEAQQWLMYIFSESDCSDRYDWILKDGKLIRVIIIEKFSKCEKMLLDFLYEYLKLNPDDYFYDSLEWFYTYEDIVKIKQRKFDPYWCYKDPQLIE